MSGRGILAGRVAIVTGAGRGIGRGEAIALARAGATVIVNDVGAALDGSAPSGGPANEVVDEIRAAGGAAIADASDVSDWRQAGALVERAWRELGGLDVLVNNAGILRDRMIVNLEQAEWDAVMAVHLRGHAAMLHFAAARWREESKTGGGRGPSVINTASEVGLFGNPGQAAYAAAKGGIIGLSLAAALELERYGVRVNVVCPRARTRMTVHAFGGAAMETEDGFDEWAPENVAPLVAYLATEDAREISGQVFIVGGARVRLMGRSPELAAIDNGAKRFDLDTLTRRVSELFRTAPTRHRPAEMLPGESKA